MRIHSVGGSIRHVLKNSTALALALGMGALASHQAMAQDGGVSVLPEIVVEGSTLSAGGVALSKQGSSVSVVTGVELQAQQIRHAHLRKQIQRLMVALGILLLPLSIMAASGVLAVDASHPLRVFKAEAEFDDVKFDLENAIVNAGLKIIYQGNIGEMLERTKESVGAKVKVYDNAEFFAFCAAPISHAIMGADPRNIGFCPYIIYAYSLAGEKGVTYVGYRRPVAAGSEASRAALKTLNKFLETLVKGVVE